MQRLILVLLLLIVFTCTTVLTTSNVSTSIVIDDVQRTIDATKPNIVRQKIVIKVVNTGSNAVERFHLALPKEFGRNHLSFLKVTQEEKELKVTNSGYEDKSQRYGDNDLIDSLYFNTLVMMIILVMLFSMRFYLQHHFNRSKRLN
jgi:hypothetical protein